MPSSTISFLPNMLLAVYAGCVCLLGVVLFLIAAFYKRKFNEATPRLGFILGSMLCAVLIVSIFVSPWSPELGHITQGVLLLGAALSSGSATLLLYFLMRRSKK